MSKDFTPHIVESKGSLAHSLSSSFVHALHPDNIWPLGNVVKPVDPSRSTYSIDDKESVLQYNLTKHLVGVRKSRNISIDLEFLNVSVDVKVHEKVERSPFLKLLRGVLCSLGLISAERVKTKRVLHSVSGKIQSKKLIALMGSSGAGKSTLLNVLSRRIRASDGEILYCGIPLPEEDGQCISGFVQQLDIFLENITVHEHLFSQLRLRLSSKVSESYIKMRENDLLKQVNLTRSRHTTIKSLSGGEKKRLNIASELCNEPPILFADEPTTGLDSFLSLSVVNVFKELALAGTAVVVTLHQPSPQIFVQFDEILLMAEGHCIYFGDRLGCIEWFDKLGFPCPTYTNPAEFIIKLVHIPESPIERERKVNQILEFEQKWLKEGQAFLCEWQTEGKMKFLKKLESASVLVKSNSFSNINTKLPLHEEQHPSAIIKEYSKDCLVTNLNEDDLTQSDLVKALVKQIKIERSSWFLQFIVYLKRTLASNRRNPFVTVVRCMQTFVLASVLGFIFFRLDYSWNDYLARISVIYLLLMNQSMAGAFSVTNTLSAEICVVRREYETGMIHPSAYMGAVMVADFPIQLIFPIFFATALYWLSNIDPSFVKYLIILVICLVVVNSAIAVGYFSSSFTGDPEIAALICNLIMLPLSIFGGMMVNVNTVPKWLSWIQYGSFLRWGFHAASVLTLRDVNVTTMDGEIISGLDFVKLRIGFGEDQLTLCLIMLAVVFVAYRAIAFVTFCIYLRNTKENQ